jgi:hypothetical protein
MVKAKTAEKDTRSQRQKFIDAARKFDTSESVDLFRRAVRQVATAPVAKPKKKARKGS